MTKLIATFFYVGLMRPAPGTWGSAAAIPVAWLIHWGLGPYGLLAGVVIAYYLGWWATTHYTRGTGIEDPSEVVIDEVAGMWTALLPLSFGLAQMGAAPHVFPYPGWIGAFLLFRLFDIWKPGPIGWADRRGNAHGVMLDDIIAGIFAGLCLVLLAAFSHLVLMS